MSSNAEVKSPVVPPPVGQSFVDDEGVYWTVKNIIEGANLDGFFLASLDHGKTPESVDGNLVLSPREYEALIRSRGLKVIAPDVAHPVRLVDVNREAPEPVSTVTLAGSSTAMPGGGSATLTGSQSSASNP